MSKKIYLILNSNKYTPLGIMNAKILNVSAIITTGYIIKRIDEVQKLKKELVR